MIPNSMFRVALLFCFLLQGSFPASLLASEKELILTSGQQMEIISAFSESLQENYVLPTKAALLVDVFDQAQARGEFSSSQSMSLFLNQINQLIQSTLNDKHLGVLNPERFSQMMAMFHGSESAHDEEPSGQSSHGQNADHGDGHASMGHAQSLSSTPENPLAVVGVSKVSEISRDGLNQTGYLALDRFDGSARAVEFIERVFSTFTESDNIIIDLRTTRGGDGEMVGVLSSYFFAEPTHLLNTIMPGEENRSRIDAERWTEPNPLSQIFAEKPLKILISDETFSAGESFAFGMQTAGRAELVGQTTGGGGYINDFFPLPYGFGASISIGRSYDPQTGKDWQGIGVIPDVATETGHALYTALTRFTQQSGKLDRLQGDELEIYQRVQKYTDAWYGADHEAMRELLSQKFVGLQSDPAGNTVRQISSEQLINDTEMGGGSSVNKIYYNRIIRNIEVATKQATVTLILRETIHQMSLTKSEGEWLISRDDFKNKRRNRA